MKVQQAARFNAICWPAVLFYTVFTMAPGLRITGVHFPRQGWIVENNFFWSSGCWFWLLAIFGWMWLLVALMWSYLPAHRLASMLQSGLMIIGATLAISGVTVWMAVLPPAMRQESATMLTPLVDALALGLIGGGAFMGGIVTLWIGLDLYRQGLLAQRWLALCLLAGLCALPTPFLLPFPYLLIVAALCWWGWALYLAFQSRLPSLYAEWK
jgi:hypothetical protein